MKKTIFVILFSIIQFANCYAQTPYKPELNQFVGTWIQPKEMDYEGIYHVLIKKIGDEIIVRAKINYPSDLPTNTTSIPISEVSYSNGNIITFGTINEMPIKPNHKLIISIENNEMHLIHQIRNNKNNNYNTISDIRLVESY